MKLDRDISILEHIVSYCEQIEQTVVALAMIMRYLLMTPSIETQRHSVFYRLASWSEN